MTLTRISCNLILKLYLQQPLFLTISKHNVQFVTPKSKNEKLQGDAPQTRKNYRCSGFMKNSVAVMVERPHTTFAAIFILTVIVGWVPRN